jgi:hypothetical protein
MPAYLMGSPSEQLDFKQAISAGGIPSSAFEGLFGLCQNFVFALSLLEFARPLTSEGMVYQPFFFCGNASNQTPVGFLNISFHKHALQFGKDLFVFGKKQAAAGGTIQPMNRRYPVSNLIPKLNEGIFFLSKGQGGFVYQQACWLIDHH